MHKKFEKNRTNIKGSCQSGRKVVTHNSKSDLPLEYSAPMNVFWVCKHVVVQFDSVKNCIVIDFVTDFHQENELKRRR